MFWKVFRKGVVNHVDTVWHPVTMTAQEVMNCIEDDYDFPVTILPDVAD